MEAEDPIDFAHAAIVEVTKIAFSLANKSKRSAYGRLGAELWLVADHIDTAGLDQEERLRSRISKLLRHVEKICNWPHQVPKNGLPLLEGIGGSLGMISYQRAQTKIRSGLDRLTTDSHATEDVIAHLHKFVKGDRKFKRNASDDFTSNKIIAKPERSRHANELVYRTLHEKMCCTCQSIGAREQMQSKHLVCLLLQPPDEQATSSSLVEFDMLFSSKPLWNESQLSHWQDVELLVPRNNSPKSKKRARFAVVDDDEHNHANIFPAKQMWQVNQGQFCHLIGQTASWCLCLSIQEEELQHCIKPIKQNVDHVPGIPLAKVLSGYRLTARMKVLLAYIIAYSVWQYYDSDWMKTKWTSESIRFMRESNASGGQGKLFTWKPYLSLHFNDEDPECSEYSTIPGMVHDFPRIRALGIMLVEIGIGFPLHKDDMQAHPPATRANKEFLTAFSYTKDEKYWRDFDYPDYMSAVRHCLEPGTFHQGSFIEMSSTPRELDQAIKQRRNILYDKVVFPLQDLLQGTKWMENYTKIAPLDISSKAAVTREPTVVLDDPEERKTSDSKKKHTKSEKDARKWLSRLRGLSRELAQVGPAVGLSDASKRVRIAILDTGYDDDVPFFFSSGVGERHIEWKDFVDGLDQPEDCHGHGTHLVSLVLKCAPEADLYVARIAKSPSDLLHSSENIAEAISWASQDCEADIISMSFGFADEQPCISKAIRKALSDRNDSILFFAAASNHGANDREMFPASHHSVISIRGTNANGKFEDFNPPKREYESIVFGTLGVDVPSSWPGTDGEEYKSGTSIATAIAAGIAGCLLGYIRSQPREKPFSNAIHRAWKQQGMLAIFRALSCNTSEAGYFYLRVWDLIGKSEDVRWAKLGIALSEL